jgi:hypothetical protein
MTKRSVPLVAIFTLITLGIYQIYWYVVTKDEMVSRGANIPTAWLLIIPFANIYWIWKWAQGVEHVTRGSSSAAATFCLIFILGLLGFGFVGVAIVQSMFNGVNDEAVSLPRARIA